MFNEAGLSIGRFPEYLKGISRIKEDFPFGGILMRSFARIGLASLFVAQLSFISFAQSIISTVAGNGIAGFSSDGGPATSSELNGPSGVAVDAAGNLFIADTDNNRIRKVTPSGIISTVAGSGSQGFSGDGGQAILARLYWPTDVRVDAAGNLFIADYSNNRIRKVTPGGIISTVAGNGTWGFSGDGGQATSARLGHPTSIAVDAAGNLFIADADNQRVRKVTPGGIISSVAGNGSEGFSGDGAQATLAQLAYPVGVAVDSTGNLFISDLNNRSFRVLSG
jgi:sugar lactone lactonase YvrE